MTLTIAGLVVAVVVAVLTAAGIAAGAVWFLSGRIDSSRVEVLTQGNQLDSKNEAAHAGIVARVDRLDTKSEAGHAEIGGSSTRLRTTWRSWQAARKSETTGTAAEPEPPRNSRRDTCR